MRVLGLNAVFHDPSAAVVVDGRIVAAAEEERFSRRKHGKPCVPFSTWELPERSARWCLAQAGLEPRDVDSVAYSYDPELAAPPSGDLTADEYEGLRTFYVRRAPNFAQTSFRGLDSAKMRFVPHHVAHAASAYLAGPHRTCSVMVLDGRGERSSYLAGRAVEGNLEIFETQPLPDSLGLRYEELTMHLGFARSSDEYKIMALAAYGRPRFLPELRELMYCSEHGFVARPVEYSRFAPARAPEGPMLEVHADLASSVQVRLEEILVELATRLHRRTGDRALVMAGGVALNCVANSAIARRAPFEDVWVQPAAGDAGTALGAALYVAHELGDRVEPMPGAALGRGWTDSEIRGLLEAALLEYEAPDDVALTVARALADDQIVGWFQGRSEFGPRALGHRSLLAHPGHTRNLQRLNDVKGREQFRPVAPMVLRERAAEIFDGPLPSPYMLFTHRVRDEWRSRLPAVTHVDGSARVQTVDAREEPLLGAMLAHFERLTGLPVVVNTSFNTAGRPMVDDPRDALECFGSTPIGLLAIGRFTLARARRAVALAGAA
ncbi:MAG: carbamoyltransferase [Candidatus Eremiobacteraeota bacterium]|nr:carbamoyltransferase [Candidatus Eremiobacteraeota bacterium]